MAVVWIGYTACTCARQSNKTRHARCSNMVAVGRSESEFARNLAPKRGHVSLLRSQRKAFTRLAVTQFNKAAGAASSGSCRGSPGAGLRLAGGGARRPRAAGGGQPPLQALAAPGPRQAADQLAELEWRALASLAHA